jgi:hypothetical protein
MRIGGVQTLCAALFDCVGVGFFRMSTQIVSKCDVTFQVRRAFFEEMKLHDAYASFVSESAVTPSGNAELAVSRIA